MEQTASNEMSNLSEPVGDIQSWGDEIPESSGNTATYQESSTTTIDYDVDELIVMIKNNDLKKIDKKEMGESMFIYKMILQDESYMENNFPYVYKNKNKFNFFKTLLSNFEIKMETLENEFKSSQSLETLFRLIKQIIRIDKGQYLLKMMPYKQILTKLISEDEFSIPLYFTSGVSSTLPVFIEIDKLYPNKSCLDISSKSILSAACRNSDVRVLKYIVNNFHDYHKPSWNNSNFIKILISQIFSYHIPVKHSLRRMKILSSKINLSPYFNYMVDIVPNLEALFTLKKYYWNDSFVPESSNINSIGNLLVGYEAEDVKKDNIEKCLSIFNRKNDKADFILNIFIRTRSLFDIDITKYIDSNYDGLQRKIGIVIDNIFNNYLEEEIRYRSKDLKALFSLCQPDITRYMKSKYIDKLLFMLPFIDYFPTTPPKGFNIYNFRNIGCQLNFIKLHIKLWLRRNQKVLKLENKLKKIRLLNEITNFKPNSSVPILSKGSFQYQLSKQEFTKLPPRHILPNEIKNLNETSEGLYLIREKADGCLVDFISKDVEPIISEYYMNNIKAEFIEDLDLYLIFDINLTSKSFIQRYNYLRSLHPATRDGPMLDNTHYVETFEQLKEEIKKERIRFQKFLKEPYKNYRIYPKATWIVKSLKSPINEELIDNIIEENDYTYVCEDGEYLNDGLIITPLDGNRELKLKPKSMHTLDLLYDGRNWVDREKNNWNHIINSKSMYTANTIWRCFPTFQQRNDHYIFEPKEYRFDKSKPNKNSVVNMIYKLHLIDWKKIHHEGTKYFYHSNDFKRSQVWNDIRECQNNHLANILEKVDPIIKSKWLDLGCGSGKLLKYIRMYNPSNYVGLDFDINQLLKAVNRIDSNQYFINTSKVIPSDLKSLWDSHPLAWDKFDSREKYEYIVSNFSLSHYHSELFWEQLNDVSKENTVFLFNIVNDNAKEKWTKGDSYLHLEGNSVVYKFDSVHKYEMKEDYITEDEILKYSKKFNWSIVEKIIPSGDDLDSKYTWYVLKHN